MPMKQRQMRVMHQQKRRQQRMFKKGDVINAIPPKEYGEWSCLMFTEDAKPVHGKSAEIYGKSPSGLSGLSR